MSPLLRPVQCCLHQRWRPADHLLRLELCALLCTGRTLHKIHAGVPRHLVFREEETAERLQAVLASVPLASVELHTSVGQLPPASLSAVVSAMSGSAATLTALYELPLAELRDMPGVAPFTELRALDLRQRLKGPQALRAEKLPASIEQLTLTSRATLDDFMDDAGALCPPALVGIHRLPNLRRITLIHYFTWFLCFENDEDGERSLSRLPPCLEVCSVSS